MPATKPSCLYFISESILYSIVLRNLADFARLATNLRPPPPSLPSAEGSPKVSASSPRFRKTILLYQTTKTASVRINLGVITFCSRSKRTLATWPSDEYVTLWIVWLATNPSPRQIFIAIWLPPSLFLSPPFVPRLPKIDETPVNIVEIVI